jgi:hypothetical protein
MAGFMSAPLSGSQLANLGLSSSATSGLVNNTKGYSDISSMVGNINDTKLGTSLAALGTNMANMGMNSESKSALAQWNSEFSKLSQKMQTLGLNSSQTSSLKGVFGMKAMTEIGGGAASYHIKNPHFNARMTSTLGKIKKMGKK